MIDWAAHSRQVAVEENHPDPDEFVRQMRLESASFNEDVIYCRRASEAGALGIAQLMPQFHPRDVACDPIRALPYAARLMVSNLAAANGNHAHALAYYNAGPTATREGIAGKRPGWPYRETVTYVSRILQISEAEAHTRLTTNAMANQIKLSDVLARARSRIGDPYVWGGKTPPSTDCSGFVAWCYQGKVRSFTDFIQDDTERVESPAPGDIVLYKYNDPEQPGVQFPHVGLYLDDRTVLDNRFGYGVGVHPQLPRTKAVRFYRRLAGVIVDTLGQTGPVVGPTSAEVETLRKQLADALTLVGEAYNHDGSVRKALASLKQQITDLESFLERSATKHAV